MGKVYTRFQTKNGAKTLLFGAAHTYMAYIREYRLPRITVGPCGLVLANSKVNKVTPLFFIKTIKHFLLKQSNNLAELLARKCGALAIKLYLFARALFHFFSEGGALSSNYGFHFVWRPYYSSGSSALHLKTFTFAVSYHISGFNGLTILSTAFRAGTYNSFLGRTTRFK